MKIEIISSRQQYKSLRNCLNICLILKRIQKSEVQTVFVCYVLRNFSNTDQTMLINAKKIESKLNLNFVTFTNGDFFCLKENFLSFLMDVVCEVGTIFIQLYQKIFLENMLNKH